MKAVLVDSSVEFYLFSEGPVFCDRSVAELAPWGATHELATFRACVRPIRR